MGGGVWVLATSGTGVPAQVASVRALGPVTVVAIGSRQVAEQAAAGGPDVVRWCEPPDGTPVEAYTAAIADLVARAAPRLVVAGTAPDVRTLLGATASRIGAVLLPGVRAVVARDDRLIVERSAVAGAVVQTLETGEPLAVTLDVDVDVDGDGVAAAPIEPLALGAPAPVRVSRHPSESQESGLIDANRVVAIGRGLRARADLDLVEKLAVALDAELACSMSVADDLGWLDKSRYVGRSGQTIAPRLYLAVGISGAPQHVEGIRGAKVVAAVNTDPDAPIFRRADYGIAGDLYEMVPALIAALAE